MFDIVVKHRISPQLNTKENATLQQQLSFATTFTKTNPLANNNVKIYTKQSMRISRGDRNVRPYSVNLEKWKEMANPRKYLNDDVMLGYINDLANGTQSKTHDGKDWFYMKSWLLDDRYDWRDMGADDHIKKLVLHCYRNSSISSFSTIVIPYNITNTHWILIAANMETDELTSYDGFHHVHHGSSDSPLDKCADLINKLLEHEGQPTKKFTFHCSLLVPKQTSGLDCCLIAALSAHAIIIGDDPNTFISGGMKQVRNLRLRLAYEIMKEVDIKKRYNTWLVQLQKERLKEAKNALHVSIKQDVIACSEIVFQPIITQGMQAKVNKLDEKITKEMIKLSNDTENVFNRTKAFEMVLLQYCQQRRNAKDHYLLPWIITEYSIMVKSILQLTNGQPMSRLDTFQSRVCRDVFLAATESQRLDGFWKSVLGMKGLDHQVHKKLLGSNKVMIKFGNYIHDRLQLLEMDKQEITRHLLKMSIKIQGIPTDEDVTGFCLLQNRQYQYKDFRKQPTILVDRVHNQHQWLLFHLRSMNFVYVMTEGAVNDNPAAQLIQSASVQFVEESSDDGVRLVEDAKKQAAVINVTEEKSKNVNLEKPNTTTKKRKIIPDLDAEEEDNDPNAGITYVDSPVNKKGGTVNMMSEGGGDKKQAVDASRTRTRSSPRKKAEMDTSDSEKGGNKFDAVKNPPVATATKDTSKRSSKRPTKAATTEKGTNIGRTNDTIEASGSESKEEDPGGGDESVKRNVSEHSGGGSLNQPCISHFRQDPKFGSCAINAANAVVQDRVFTTKDAESAAQTVGNKTGYRPETKNGNYELPHLQSMLETKKLFLKQLSSKADSDAISADADNQAFIVLTQQNQHGGCHFHPILKVNGEVWNLDSTKRFPMKLARDPLPSMIEKSAKHDNSDFQKADIQGATYTVRNKGEHVIFLVVEDNENGLPFRPSWQNHELPNSFQNLPILSVAEHGYNERRIWPLTTLESESQILQAATNTSVTIIVPPFPGFKTGGTWENEKPESSGVPLNDVVTPALSGTIMTYPWFMKMILSGECNVHISCGSSVEYTMGWQTMLDIKVGLFSNSVITCRIEYPLMLLLADTAVASKESGQTKKKRDNKRVKIASSLSCSLPLIPGRAPARNAKNASKPQVMETWLNSFTDSTGHNKTVLTNIVKSSKRNANCSMEDKEDPPKIETGRIPVADQVATSTDENTNFYSEDLKSQIRKSAMELEKKHPKKSLRSKNNCLQGGASIDAFNVVGVLDRVDMLDALSLSGPDTSRIRKNYVHLNKSPRDCEDLKMLCCDTILGINDVWDKRVKDDVQCLAFLSLWLSDPKCESSVRYLQIDSILFYRYSISMEGQVGEVKVVLSYSRCPKAGLLDRLLFIAKMLSRNESAIDPLYPDSVDSSLGRYFANETTISFEYQRKAVHINTNGVEKLVDCLVNDRQTSDAWTYLTTDLLRKNWKAAQLRSLTRFPMSFITHNIKRPQENMILGILCELYQMTSIEVWRLENDGDLLCSLHCSCCGEQIGPANKLSELLRYTPRRLLKHHGIIQKSVVSVIEQALENKPMHEDDDEKKVMLCQYGNGNLESVKEKSDIERDVKKRLSFTDAAIGDRMDSKLIERSVDFIAQFHSDVPKAMGELNSFGEDIPPLMINAHKMANHIRRVLQKIVLSLSEQLSECRGFDAGKVISCLVSKDWKGLEPTDENHGSDGNGSDNAEINHVTSQRPTKFRMDETNLMKEGSMDQHKSWDDNEDPSLQLLPSQDLTSPDVYFKTSVLKSPNDVNTERQCLEYLVTILYASEIYRTGKLKNSERTPEILRDLLEKVGWERINSESVYIVKCCFTKKVGLPFLTRLKKIVASNYPTQEAMNEYLSKLGMFFPSKEFLKSFSKETLEDIRQGKWWMISKPDSERLTKPIRDAHNNQAVSVALVQLCPPIYEVCVEKKKNRGSKDIIYVTDKSIDIGGTLTEPWVCDGLKSLDSVLTGTKVILAEGKRSGDPSTSTPQPTSRPSQLRCPNLWYDKDNKDHLCLAGSIVNCIGAMGHQSIAETLKNSMCNTTLTDRDHTNPLDSELFKLLNENRIFYKEVISLLQLDQLLSHLSLGLSSYPCVLFLSDTQSIGQTHVVVIWRGSVYDIESKFPYDLTMNNLSHGCGCDVQIVSLKRMLILFQQDEHSMKHLPRKSDLDDELARMTELVTRNTSKRLNKMKRKKYRKRKGRSNREKKQKRVHNHPSLP